MTGRHSTRALRAASNRHTRSGIAWRQFAADPWVSAALALLVAVASLLLLAVPRALEDVNGRQLTSDVSALSAMQRDVTGGWGTTVEPGPPPADGTVLQGWEPFVEGAEQIRSAQPEPLRSLLQTAQMHARLTTSITVIPPIESGYYEANLTVYADPDLAQHVKLVEGAWPRLEFLGESDSDPAMRSRTTGAESGAAAGPTGREVLVLDEALKKLNWQVGDQLQPGLVISGTYRPTEPDDPRWQHLDNGAKMGVVVDPNRGEAAQVSLFLNPENRGLIDQPAAVRMELWFPVSADSVTSSRIDPALVRQQLTGMIAQEHVIVEKGNPVLGPLEGDQVPSFSTELTTTLDTTVKAQRATSSLLAVVAAGPLGVAVAVVALAAQLVISRRHPALAMTLARGASARQLRWLIAWEGVLLGVPAALAGHLIARLVLPGSSRWWEWLITAVVAVTPAMALAVSLDDASLLQERRDLSSRSRSRWRWVAEVAVVTLAGLATWRLLDRDARGDAASASGIDLLAAAAPVMLALAACVAALRLYPLPLAALSRALRRQRRLTPFLGSARALRDPAGGLVPALAVVLGTTIALVSAVLLTTVTAGAQTAAWANNGADIRVRGPFLTDELTAQVRALDGVEAVARIRDAGTTQELSQGRTAIRLLLVDPALQQVLGSDSVALGPPAGLYADDIPIPVVAGGSTPATTGTATLRGAPVPVQIIDHLDQLPGYPSSGSWLLMDAERWAEMGKNTPVASTALISVVGGADRATVAQAVRAAVGPSVVTTVDEQLERFTSAPVTRGLTMAFIGATVLTGLLTVLSIVVVQLMGARARAKLLAILRTLGLAPDEARTLTAWELAPLLVTSVVVGATLGLAVPWILVHTLDLRGLTGGSAHPALVVDPLVVGTVLGAVLLTVLLAINVSAWLAGRTNLAQALRVGEER
ncbi:MAG: hypothetical protein Q4P07_06950 [Ornithinimicrobium sp.]|uniref:ABC transporter permease n=1 Tax=Ornithinimicrobium sp. TaxID=1977084 RepID=UPI0026DF325C|nr:FtsX-like permease family protein [Ornithinimicrobium sp.]MDO5739871.1 hypothetical protein [Ornithinimicrobium sp.]